MLDRRCSSVEADELVQWLSAEPQDSEAARLINEELQKVLLPEAVNDERVQAVVEECLNRILTKERMPLRSIHRVHFLRRSWFRYAAAAVVVLLLGSAVLLYIRSGRNVRSGNTEVVGRAMDIQPGINKAILTVGDSSINLSNHKTGIITASGAVAYNDGERIADAGQMLTLTTPRGGQYQAMLPDGSRVWLNAASSIRFPSKFTGNAREITITGEVYLEVAKKSKQPFVVKVDGREIVVIGTSFNVNAYKDEPGVKISLVEGAVKIDNKLLKPGEAYYKGQVIRTDVDQDIAWKKGWFSFTDADFPTVMRQLARWYAINVQYEAAIPSGKFNGKIGRDLSLNEVLDGLTKNRIKYKIGNGNTIVILK